MSAGTLLLYGFEVLALLAALGIVIVKNIFHAALLLMVCLLALAGVYILLNAEFIAVMQILIYAGGILVLIIFGIMLTSRLGGKPLVIQNQYVFGGSMLSVVLAASLIRLFSQQEFYQNNTRTLTSTNPINQIGVSLMSDYAFAFELTGVLLLIALIGAAVTASSFNTKQ